MKALAWVLVATGAASFLAACWARPLGGAEQLTDAFIGTGFVLVGASAILGAWIADQADDS